MKTYASILFALAMTAPLTGCLIDGPETTGDEDVSMSQGLENYADSDNYCFYRGSVTCTHLATGEVVDTIDNFYLAIPRPAGGGACAATHDYVDVTGFGNTEVSCEGIIVQEDDEPVAEETLETKTLGF